MIKSVTVFAPASVGNIGPGFDVLGMALSGMGDTLIAEYSDTPGIHITKITGDEGQLPLDAKKNTAGIAAQALLDHLGIKTGMLITLHKDIPGTGLGSSAASAVAGAFAANALYGNTLSKSELIPFAGAAEAHISGARFLDNVGPALMGGVTWNNRFTQEVLPLGCIEAAFVITATPDFKVLTKDSRGSLPDKIPMSDVVFNLTNVAIMSWAVAQKDVRRFGRGIQDKIAEPARAGLIPGFESVKQAALSHGALGCSISGAGATLFAVAETTQKAEQVCVAMGKAFEEHGIPSKTRVSTMDAEGARVLEST